MDGNERKEKIDRDNREVSDGLIASFKIEKRSQCANCKNALKGNKCHVYGIKPDEYVYASRGIKCPNKR